MRKFLIVDDNIALADNLAEVISDANLGQAVLAESGVQALLLAAGTRFDALVSDVRMPKMGGVELIQRMRIVDPGLPAVLMTAYTTADALLAARREGILCILPKPVPIARLLELLRHARRDGVVALVAPDTARTASLAERMRSNGFAPMTVGSLAEMAAIGGSPFAVVVDIRALGDLEGAALLCLATSWLQLPTLTLTSVGQRRPQPACDPRVFAAWPQPERLMNELEILYDGRRAGRSTGSESRRESWRARAS